MIFVTFFYPQVYQLYYVICKLSVSLKERTKELDLKSDKQFQLFMTSSSEECYITLKVKVERVI